MLSNHYVRYPIATSLLMPLVATLISGTCFESRGSEVARNVSLVPVVPVIGAGRSVRPWFSTVKHRQFWIQE